MSGGSWNYIYRRLQEAAEPLTLGKCGIQSDDDVDESEDTRRLRIMFGGHLSKCADALKAIEWFDSGDTDEEGMIELITRVIEDPNDVISAGSVCCPCYVCNANHKLVGGNVVECNVKTGRVVIQDHRTLAKSTHYEDAPLIIKPIKEK